MTLTASQVVADYADAFSRGSEPVEIDRQTGTSHFRVTTRARVKDAVPDTATKGIIQSEVRLRALISDLIAGQFPLPVRTTDAVWVRGRRLAITAVDNNMGRVATTQVYVLIHAKG